MANDLNEKEEKVLISMLLDIDPEQEEIVDFVIIAHIHERDKDCDGKVQAKSNCDGGMARILIKSCMDKLRMGS